MKICPICSTEYGDDVKFCKNDGAALRALAPAADLVGQVIAERYHVIKKLGEGGMGQVYLAEHVKMGRRSAIKVMNPAMVHDPDAIARFNREASNASRITHPHVCAIYDFGETPDGLIYLAMEFVEGEPLTDVLEREGALAVDRAATIFLQTADALQSAHDLGIVHRDLKPDNIMLTRARAGADLVKVVDFGIAKAVGGGGGGGGDQSQKVTKTGLVIGTPEFMSPEQLAGDKLDGRSDLYSLALVLFRMLTGRLPFDADTVQETMIQRLTDEPKKLAEARPDLRFPPGLQGCFDSALARSPAERYQTVAQFAGDVSGVLGLGPGGAAAVPRTRPDPDAKTELLESAGTKVLGRRSTPPTRPSPPAAATPARRSKMPIAIGVLVLLGAGGAGVALLSDGEEQVNTNPTGDTTDPGNAGGTPSGETAKQRPRVDVSRARETLDTLMLARLTPTTARTVRDSATVLYDAPGISRADRAYAAFVIGNSYFQEGDRSQGCSWIRSAVQLDPVNATYGRLMPQCQS